MNTRLTRTLTSAPFALAVLCALTFFGTGITHVLADGAACVQTAFWRNASRMLKAVLSQGPFTEAVAQWLSVLGWFVAEGTPMGGLIVGWSQSWLVASMASIVGSGHHPQIGRSASSMQGVFIRPYASCRKCRCPPGECPV